jgi:hypothetical protein
MLRMNMTQAEKDLVAIHKKALQIYPAYTCNCCRNVIPKGMDDPLVDVFRAPPGIRLTVKGGSATFVICQECQKLGDPEITKGVLAGFLMEKLAVVRV